MKKIFLIVITFLFIGICDMYSQVIKMEHGANLTWMDGGGYAKKRGAYSFMLGCDYLEKDWFMLSSEIGYIQRGGRSLFSYTEGYDPDRGQYEYNYRRIAKLDFFQINTTFRFKHDFKRFTLFMGVGPTIDILLKDRSEYQKQPINSDQITTTETSIHHNNVLYGLKYELGINYHINNKWNAILNFSQLNSFKGSTIGHYDGDSFRNKIATLSLGIGYRL